MANPTRNSLTNPWPIYEKNKTKNVKQKSKKDFASDDGINMLRNPAPFTKKNSFRQHEGGTAPTAIVARVITPANAREIFGAMSAFAVFFSHQHQGVESGHASAWRWEAGSGWLFQATNGGAGRVLPRRRSKVENKYFFERVLYCRARHLRSFQPVGKVKVLP